MKINHEEFIKEVQNKFRNLEILLRKINNREMELAIINLQQAAHWSYQATGREQAEEHLEKNKDG